ncbi:MULTISPECIES: type II toxin-antitoxin system HipA family toxin [Stakelama]|uniref:HipA domain-containing protein n=3 Tax=Stakelama TaxID=1124625 RepID=A0A8T4IKP2_9SPHN|nr:MULTISPECIES: type II toxin-antitoxin system HipA family toxin [Stakelama]MAW99922.1 kinase [Sphingomonas sp.]MBR0552746.1 HipA domain-containing protein [Stakelama marina]TDN85302.1 serine/threonine-protein kinase HipA [Stakelama pacifica]WNO53481.1 type II toxin-antitoxin system HipA family toxin [Stakelama sp. W311]GGO93038.1 putative kinase Y4dM [Stakelama pacifica]|tara:strand:- start:983 stop:2200 length:1218 start_codon:yes stop_codon:yes gene_type:complete
MTDARALDIFLYDRRIGTITLLDGDHSIFTFDEGYVADEARETLSLSVRDEYGALITDTRAYRTRVAPFFSNLLPEGTLRDYLAKRAGVKASREFQLLAELGTDLPGAIRAVPVQQTTAAGGGEFADNESHVAAPPIFRFSLAGVQLKFSALKNRGKNGGLTIPAHGNGGDWIVKLPSTRFSDVPENEFASMSLARHVGIEVPDIDLVPVAKIEGLPEGIGEFGDNAYAIRRFDRTPHGPVHIEDFAQVFGVYPDDKYENASYRNILSVLAIETDEASIEQFVRRLTFSVLIGNGDMHLKNWSLVYPDRRAPILSPAYDLLSTVPYLGDEEAALKFRRSKAWGSYTYDELGAMADKARLATRPVIRAAKDTVERFDAAWASERDHLPLSSKVIAAIDRHRGHLVI